MGDATTHAIFYSAYWYLVYRVDETSEWMSTSDFSIVCKCGEEDMIVILPTT